MKAAIQRFQGMVIEQDAKVKQAQDELASTQQSVEALKMKLAEQTRIAAEYRMALDVLRRPGIGHIPQRPVGAEVPPPPEPEQEQKPARKRA